MQRNRQNGMSDQGDQNIRSKEIYWKKNIYLTLL